jgi:hypothetical protein
MLGPLAFTTIVAAATVLTLSPGRIFAWWDLLALLLVAAFDFVLLWFEGGPTSVAWGLFLVPVLFLPMQIAAYFGMKFLYVKFIQKNEPRLNAREKDV